MFRILIKVAFCTASISMLLIVLGYTVDARNDRAGTPSRIGDARVDKPFLVEFTEIRQEMLMGYLRDTFPDLQLPEPQAPPPNPLSLQSLKERTLVSQAQQQAKPKARRSGTGSRPQSEEPPKLRVLTTSR